MENEVQEKSTDTEDDTKFPTTSNQIETGYFPKNSLTRSLQKVPIFRMPYCVHLILVDEIFLHICDQGLRSLLAIYFQVMLDINGEEATVALHVYFALRSFLAMLGAALADGYLGKYFTIVIASSIDICGVIMLSISSGIVQDFPNKYIMVLAMLFMTFGFAGLFGCVMPFAGDQFSTPDQKANIRMVFILYYLGVQIGELCAIIFLPMITDAITWKGRESYPIAFAFSAGFVCIGFGIFLAGTKLYIKRKPTHPFPLEWIKCIGYAARKAIHNLICKRKNKEKKSHWIKFADDKYEPTIIEDTIRTWNVIRIPMLTFWCLHEQKSTTWTFQAARMDCKIGQMIINPGQVQCLEPFMLLFLIPIFHYGIYPWLAKHNFMQTVLRRMALGGFMIAIAFILAEIIEYKLEETYKIENEVGFGVILCFNGLRQEVKINIPQMDISETVLPHGLREFRKIHASSYIIVIKTKTTEISDFVQVAEGKAISLLIDYNDEKSPVLKKLPNLDKLGKTLEAVPRVRLVCSNNCSSTTISLINSYYSYNFSTDISSTCNQTSQKMYPPAIYTVDVNGFEVGKANLKLGGVYAILVYFKNTFPKIKIFNITPPNSLSVLWMIPQYFFFSLGSMLYILSSQIFIYTEAPENITSFAWCMTYISAGSGNVLTVIITNIMWNNEKWIFIVFAGVMLINLLFFLRMTHNYKYKDKEKHIKSLLGL